MWLRNTYRSLKIEYQLNLLKSLAVIHVYCFKCLIFRSVLGNVFRIMAKIAISKIQCPTFYISIKINGVSHHASVNLTMTVSLCRSIHSIPFCPALGPRSLTCFEQINSFLCLWLPFGWGQREAPEGDIDSLVLSLWGPTNWWEV